MHTLNEIALGAEEISARKELSLAKRIVVKIGTATVTRPKIASAEPEAGGAAGGTGKTPRITALARSLARAEIRARGGVDSAYLNGVAAQCAELAQAGKELIFVTSGAIGMGARELGLAKRVTEVRMRQACAAIGQPLLMDEYRRAFGVFGLTTAQLLVTRDAWDSRGAYLNLRSTVEALLEEGVIPVFNENDSVSTAEIGNAFGDNDRLSAYVASKIDADALLILSDVSCLYNADPRENPEALPIPYVRQIGPELMAMAGGRGTEFSTGGMQTKLVAVGIARDAGCRVVIAHGREPGVIGRVMAGERLGTLFDAESALRNRTRWLKNTGAQGTITVDEGALKAVRGRRSLLPSGVTDVAGEFARGAVVSLNGVANLMSGFSSAELRAVMGMRTPEVEAILPAGSGHIVARPEDIVFLDA